MNGKEERIKVEERDASRKITKIKTAIHVYDIIIKLKGHFNEQCQNNLGKKKFM